MYVFSSIITFHILANSSPYNISIFTIRPTTVLILPLSCYISFKKLLAILYGCFASIII